MSRIESEIKIMNALCAENKGSDKRSSSVKTPQMSKQAITKLKTKLKGAL